MRSVPIAVCVSPCALLLSLFLGLSLASSSAQSPETESTTPQANTGVSGARGQETSHHEAGSVEVSQAALRDRHFLRKAMASGFEEAELSRLILGKTTDEDIKRMATQVIADQTRINESLKAAAEAQGVMLPTKLSPSAKNAFQKLASLSDEELSRKYVVTLAEDRRRDLSEYRLEAAATEEERLRDALLAASRIIHDHMVAARQIARAKDISLQPAANVETSSASRWQ